MFKNILALDYGTKRWGLAFCDELRVVFALPAATQLSFEERVTYLKGVIKQRQVSLLLVGLPLTLEGNKSALTLGVESFIEKTLQPLGLPIQTIDEGLSSYAAESATPKPKMKKGRPVRDGTVDSKAAALLLEDYIAQHTQ